MAESNECWAACVARRTAPLSVRHSTASTAITHITILEHLEGKTVNWMEKVSDEEYRAASGAE